MSSNAVANQVAEQAKLANLARWTRASCEGLRMARSGRLPEHQAESAWPFESRLMNLAVLGAEAGQLPPVEVLFLLSACSEGGEIEPGMQPARADEHRRIDRLCEALGRIVDGRPGEMQTLRQASARSLADPGHRLWLERLQPLPLPQQHQYHQEQQHQTNEEMLRAMFAPDAAAAFVPGPVLGPTYVPAGAPGPAPASGPAPATPLGPVFADDPWVADGPMVIDDRGVDWQPQLDMGLPAQTNGASMVLEEEPGFAEDDGDAILAMMEAYLAAPVPEGE